jgi:hypothetical protein
LRKRTHFDFVADRNKRNVHALDLDVDNSVVVMTVAAGLDDVDNSGVVVTVAAGLDDADIPLSMKSNDDV